MKFKVEVTRNSNGSVELRPLRSDRKDSDFATEDAKIELSQLSQTALRALVIDEQYEISIEPVDKDAARSTRKSVTTLAAEGEAAAEAAARAPDHVRKVPLGKQPSE